MNQAMKTNIQYPYHKIETLNLFCLIYIKAFLHVNVKYMPTTHESYIA